MIYVKYEHLIGRPFVYGSNDCYGLARDFYRDNWGFELTDYARADGWADTDQNLIIDHLHDEGFGLVHEPIHLIRPGDALVVAIRSKHPNHIGMFLGDNKILHHRQGQFSQVVPFSGIFRNLVCAHVRHKDIVQPKITATKNLVDFLSPHKRAELADALQKQLSANAEGQGGA